MKLRVREYVTAEGKNPFREWLNMLDVSVRARVQARIFRFETGNLGDHKSVGVGVWEARLPFGPGYRVYFGKEDQAAILLLLGGDKASQRKDIRLARQFWIDYLEMTRHGKGE